MNLAQRIDEDLKQAMKARDEAKVSALRMLKAGMVNAALAKKKESLDDGEVIEVVAKLIKQREESVEAFTKGGRPDAAAKEAKEAQLLKGFLPPAMDESELKAIVSQTIQELRASGPSALGTVMKALLPKVKGRADNKLVSQLVNQLLGAAK